MPTYCSKDSYASPIIQWDSERGLYQLMDDYIVNWVNKLKVPCRYHFPKGLEYDEASVPTVVPPVLARPNGPWDGPSFPHDMSWKYCQHGGKFPPGMYQQQLITGEWVNVDSISQWDSNDLLQEMGQWALNAYNKKHPSLNWFDAFKYRASVQLWPPNWFKGF